MSSSQDSLAIPAGTWVLVTGANGFLASHVIDQLLRFGYRVRGTVRDVNKAAWVKSYFSDKYGAGSFELVAVPDISVDGAFDEVMKGMSGAIHIASMLVQANPEESIPPMVASGREIVKAAAKVSSVKRVVYTSSSVTTTLPKPGVEFVIDENTWNDESIEKAWAPPPYERSRSWDVYAAIKASTEKEMWKFVKEQKPSFTLNTVLPNANFGRILNVKDQGFPSTADWLKVLYEGGEGAQIISTVVAPQWFVDVQDTALIHVAALVKPDVNGRRLLAFAEPFSWVQLLDMFKKMYPDKQFTESVPDKGEDLSKPQNQYALECLEWAREKVGEDRKGWTPMEQSIRWTLENLSQSPERSSRLT